MGLDAKHQERFEVRLVISLLPRKQAMQARARKQERIRHKKGSKANLAPAWWAGVMIIGTTLPQEILVGPRCGEAVSSALAD